MRGIKSDFFFTFILFSILSFSLHSFWRENRVCNIESLKSSFELSFYQWKLEIKELGLWVARMEGSESEAVFNSLNLNPQLFINEALNSVDDLVDDAFDFYLQ